MERGLKERLVGAAVLVALAVIFIPMLLDDAPSGPGPITETNIPPRPDTLTPDINPDDEFKSHVIPIEPPDPAAVELPPSQAGDILMQPSDAVPEPVEATPSEETQPQATSLEPEPEPESESAPPEPESATSEPEPKPEPAPPKEAQPQAAPQPEDAKSPAVTDGWIVQLGSFAQQDNAEDLNKKLQTASYDTFVEPADQSGARVYRVRIGPQPSREAAEKLRDAIKAKFGINGIVVSYP